MGDGEEDEQSFHIKLRTDMIQVVRDQHQLLQDWACQWDSRSAQQLHEIARLVGELREEIKGQTVPAQRQPLVRLGESFGESKAFAVHPSPGKALKPQDAVLPEHVPATHGLYASKDEPPGGRRARQCSGASSVEGDPGKLKRSETLQSRAAKSTSRADSFFASSVAHTAESVNLPETKYWWPAVFANFPAFRETCGYRYADRLGRCLSDAKEPERTGFLASVSTSIYFEVLCMLVILTNTCSIFISTNYAMRHLTDDGTEGQMQAFDAAFTIYYMIELVVKLTVHRGFFFLNSDKVWNIFDLLLVSVGMVEMVLWVVGAHGMRLNPALMRCFRFLKLSKTLRVVRVMRYFRELRLMLKCVVGSFVSLFWASVMFACFTVMFAMFFVQQLTTYLIDEGNTIDPEYAATVKEQFGSVQTAMLSLFKSISGGNDWDLYFPIVEKTGWANAAIFIFYILLVWISLTNIITSVFVEKALDFAQPGMEERIEDKHRRDKETAEELRELLKCYDIDDSGSISWEEFRDCLLDKSFRDYLEFRDLDVKDAETFFQMLGSVTQGGEVDINTIIGSCLRLKGQASSVDLMSVSCEIRHISQIVGALAQQQQLGDKAQELIEEERATGRGKVRSGTEEEPIDWEDLLQDVEDLSLYDMRVSM